MRCFVVQSFTLKKYPAELSLTALICLMGTVEGAAVSLVMEHDMSVWQIGWDSRLLAAVYSVSRNELDGSLGQKVTYLVKLFTKC